MASATQSGRFGLSADRAAPIADGVGTKLKRLASRLADMLEERRQREVDEQVARLLAQSGGRFTDSVERDIMRKVLCSGSGLLQ
jgi:trimethylamine:corrinoid methyltransferase-like protein